MDQLTEILVLGEKHAFLSQRKADHLFIVGSRRQLGDQQDLMPAARQRTNHGVVATLVGRKRGIPTTRPGRYAGPTERTSS